MAGYDEHQGAVGLLDGGVRGERDLVGFPLLSGFRRRLDEVHDAGRLRNPAPFSGIVVHGGAGYHSRTNEAKHRELLERQVSLPLN